MSSLIRIAILPAADVVLGDKQHVIAFDKVAVSRDLHGIGSGPAPASATMFPQNGWLVIVSEILKQSKGFLLAKEWHNGSWTAIAQTASSSSCSAMMNDSCDMLEKPLMGTVVDEEDSIAIHFCAQLAPTSRDDCPNPGRLHSIYQDLGHANRIFQDDAAKSNVDWS